jgi:thioredoxin-related protein
MKKLLLSLLFVFTSLHAEVEWFEYEKALESAKDTNKIIMVMLGRGSCSVCRYMKTVVFHDKNVIKKLQPKFISVYLELDFDDVPEEFTYVGTPTFYFVDKNEKILYHFNGGKTVPSFLQALDEVN